ncbi:MAG: SH3 domain-containing protein [Anaerolineae bacterium]|nr:SH3 domain-containing protein [Anaerolineae bacterium]
MSWTPPPPDTLPEEVYENLPGRKPKPRQPGPLPPFWAVALTFFVALGMTGCLIAAVIGLGGRSQPRAEGEPLILITSAPSPTSRLEELLGPTATADLFATPLPLPPQSIELSGPTLIPTATMTTTPIAIAVGAQVVVISQGGINVRAAPGTASGVSFTANHNDTFSVIGGPEVVDGLRWWQIRDGSNSSRSGWVADNDGVADLIEVYLP